MNACRKLTLHLQKRVLFRDGRRYRPGGQAASYRRSSRGDIIGLGNYVTGQDIAGPRKPFCDQAESPQNEKGAGNQAPKSVSILYSLPVRLRAGF